MIVADFDLEILEGAVAQPTRESLSFSSCK
jgi:hypothetical protein